MDLIFLHDPVASGKLALAHELSSLTGLPVFHNHLLVDVLLEVFEFGSPEFIRLREQFRLEPHESCMRASPSTPRDDLGVGIPAEPSSAVTRPRAGSSS